MKNTICEKLMWTITNGTVLKFLAKEFSKDEMRAIKSEFRKRYIEMRTEIDDIGPLMKNPLRICLAGGVIWLAAYEACNGRMDEDMFSRMITDTINSPLYKKAFGAKDPFVSEKQKKKVAALRLPMKSPTANITGRPAALPAEMKQSISAPTADAACVRLAGNTDTPSLLNICARWAISPLT